MEKKGFPLLFWPVFLKGDTIYVLDEAKLPHKTEYIRVQGYRKAVSVIKQMKTRAVGQVLLVLYTYLYIYRNTKNKKYLQSKFKKISDEFNTARPTLSFRYLTDMVYSWQESGQDIEKNILDFLNMLKEKRIQQAKKAAKLIKKNEVILTHCNVSGLMALIGRFSQGKNPAFFVTETRPYLQGARLTSWELQEEGFPVTVISDNMVAQVMCEKKIDKVIVGADNLARNGDIANKVGTYQIAILAKHFKIPFYVLCPPPSRAKSGKQIKIEIRPDKELLNFAGKMIAPKGVRGYYPAFDITPNDLITKHIYLEV